MVPGLPCPQGRAVPCECSSGQQRAPQVLQCTFKGREEGVGSCARRDTAAEAGLSPLSGAETRQLHTQPLAPTARPLPSSPVPPEPSQPLHGAPSSTPEHCPMPDSWFTGLAGGCGPQGRGLPAFPLVAVLLGLGSQSWTSHKHLPWSSKPCCPDVCPLLNTGPPGWDPDGRGAPC